MTRILAHFYNAAPSQLVTRDADHKDDALTDEVAEVVKWQTRTFEGRVAQAVRVQVPPSAPSLSSGRIYAPWALVS